MARKSQILFDILRACVTSARFDSPALSEADLAPMYSFYKFHDLSHMVEDVLKPAILTESHPVFQQFHQDRLIALYRYSQTEAEFSKVCSLFSEAKIAFLPLKGAVIRDFYPKPWMRTSCDIDILVHKQDLRRAKRALTKQLGYKTETTRYHDVSLYSPNGVHLELHFSICENMHPADSVLKQVWDYTFRKGDDPFWLSMKDEYLLFHIIAHGAHHFYRGGCGVKTLLDLWILENKLQPDRQKLQDLLEKAELLSFYRGLMQLIGVLFADEEHTELTLQMERYIVFGGQFGQLENSLKVSHAMDKNSGSFLLRKLFPPLRAMKEVYRILNPCPFLLPILWLVRLLRLLCKRGAGRSVEELKLIPKIKSDDTRRMLEQLGLLK